MRPENRARLGANDVVLASHPGSGTHWIATLLVELGIFYASGHDELLLDRSTQRTGGWQGPSSDATPAGSGLSRPGLDPIERRRRLPQLARDGAASVSFREPLRVVLTNHSALGQAVEQPVVLLVRDGRDALLSLYHHLRSFGGLECDFGTFLEGNRGAWPPPAFSWGVSTWSWVGAIPSSRLFALRFEDARADPEGCFGRLLAFLGVERTQEELRRAIDASSYDAMRRREDEGAGGGTARVMRKGRVGEWRDVYDSEQLARFRGLPTRVLAHFGYPVEPDATD
ncbi:MAG: hypothetical protein GC161_09210 [Planctomycetaceae bacterium]|nr:hypothetical protein [Planctomycetaceae bacterium]